MIILYMAKTKKGIIAGPAGMLKLPTLTVGPNLTSKKDVT